jgi:hypothetical protein
MKKSNRIIIILIAACGLFITGGIVASRFIITSSDWLVGSAGNGSTVVVSSEMATEVIDAEDFINIVTAGSWELTIEHGSEYLVKMTAPKDLREYLEIFVDGRELHFSVTPGTRFSGSHKVAIEITMPFLEAIISTGQLELAFDGFNGDLLSLYSSGVITAWGENSSFSDLKIETKGVANLKLDEVLAERASINMSGAGSASLNIGAGELTGSLGGVCQLTYTGTPSLVEIDAGGLSMVSRLPK